MSTSFRWSLFWLALLAVLAVAGLWMSLRLREMRAAYPGLSPAALGGLAAYKSYGVSVDLAGQPPEQLDATLKRMQAMGLRWVRQPFPWAQIEPAPGRFDWAAWDRVVEAASQSGLRLIAVLDTAPAWARPVGSSPFTPPSEWADYGEFARALAARYGQRIDHYQIWHEPNLSAHWGDQFVDPAAYAGLLREAAANIRAADPDSILLTAALAPTAERGPLNLNEPDFLAGLYAANAAPWFDVVAVQPYGFEQAPGAPPGDKSLNFSRAELVRATMLAHGDADKPIWVTAFGWSAGLPSGAEDASPWPPVSPQQQAEYTAEAIRQARANWPWLGPMLFAAWDAQALPPGDPRRGLALVAGQSLLPPARALHDGDNGQGDGRVAGEELASVGTYPADHPSGQYAGDWRFSPLGADPPRQPPATLTIPFDGTRLDLMVRRGAFRGFLYVTIDGQPANGLPRQAGRAYAVLYDPLYAETVLTLARYLPDGRHVAVIEADGGWHQWPIAGWRVSREADTRAAGLSLAVVAGLAVLAAAGLANSVRRLPAGDVRRVWGWGEAVAARYTTLPTPAHLALLALAALAFYFAPGALLSLGLLSLLFLAILPRPDLGLGLVAFSIPFFLLPKPLLGRTISVTEVGLVLVALACVAGRALGLLARAVGASHPPGHLTGPGKEETIEGERGRVGVVWLDWAAWAATAVALLAGLLTVVPAPGGSPLAVVDWASATLLLLPLAGVLAAVAQAAQPGGLPAARGVRGLDLAVMALVGLALAASLAAPNLGVALQEFHVVVWDGAAFYAFLRLLRGAPGRDRPAERLVWTVVDAFVLGAALMALYAVYQFFFTDQAITAEGVHRALGVYGSPNNLALLLDRAIPILIAVAAHDLTGLPSVGKPVRSSDWRRLLYALALLPTLAALALTFSRGALLLGLPAAILFIGAVRGGRALWAALAVLLAAAGGLLPLLGTDRFRSLLDVSSGTGFFRLRLWQSAWAMLWDHPWLGVGPDNFLYAYRTRYILPDAWQEPNLSHPHNILLDFATRLGLGGVAVLAWLQVAFWGIAWRLYRRQPEGDTRALALGLMASMAAILAHGLVDNSFFLVDLAFIFFLITGSVARLADWKSGRMEEWKRGSVEA